VDLVSLFSGRWYSWRPYYDSLRSLFYPRDKLRLWWYSNSADHAFLANLAGAALALKQLGYSIRLMVDPTLTVSRNALRELRPGDRFPGDHCEVIAALYNRATAWTEHDVFFLEDDMAVPADALLRLQNACLKHGAGYAVGVVRDRHSPDWFCWNIVRDNQGEVSGALVDWQSGVHPVGLGGFACTYIPRWSFDALSNPKFKPYAPRDWKPGKIAGCDMVLCLELETLEIARVCDMDLKTRHYDSQGRAHG
jgi:hypothetical protein